MDLIGALKKINTNSLIYEFSKLSIEMFNKNEYLLTLQHPVIRYGKHQICNVTLMGWDILEIDYLSAVHSNDDRSAKNVASPAALVSLYRDYENEQQRDLQQIHDGLDGIFRMILGMTSEQFKYQNLNWVFERFNRNYHMLIAGENYAHRAAINVDAIINEVLGMSARDYIAVFVMLMWLCMQLPDPLSAPEKLYRNKTDTVLTRENLTKLVKYYSCTYQDLRSTPLKKQLLYSKPFILTKKSGYLMSSFFSLLMTLGNGLYWLVRDYYRMQGTQKFIDTFGLLFEDYVIDLAGRYCKEQEWQQLPKTKKKGADFLFSFSGTKMLVEAKSALIQLDTMQQVPNDDAIIKYFDKTIYKAYEQLNSSYSELFSNTDEEVLKVILLYDEFSNTSILEKSMRELFYNDQRCFVITIREFEILLYLHKNDSQAQATIFDQLSKAQQMKGERTSFDAVLQRLQMTDNPHMQNSMDYFTILLEHFKHCLI